jgi:phospholipid/cholesterol/gamma-HCH transport system substrate-binding protein
VFSRAANVGNFRNNHYFLDRSVSISYLVNAMNDRLLGYLILLLLAAAILGIGGFMANALLFPPEKRVFILDNIGSLQIDDLLKVRGASVGHISRIDHRNRDVFVTISLQKHLPIYKNYQIILAEKGVLGERFLSIEPGDPSTPELGLADTLHGPYIQGIADILGRAWKLEPTIRKIRLKVDAMLHGAPSEKPLVSTLQELIHSADTSSIQLLSTMRLLNREFADRLDSLDSLVDRTDASVAAIVSSAQPTLNDIDTMLLGAARGVNDLDTLVTGLQTLVKHMEQKEGILWDGSLARLTQDLDRLQKTLKNLAQTATRLKLKIMVGK